jgi:hypothetical protein
MTWTLGQHPNIQPMPETAWIASMAVAAVLAFNKGSEREKFSHLSNVQYPAERFLPHMGNAIHEIVCEVYEERCRQIYGEDYRDRGIRLNPANPNYGYQVRRHVEDPKARWVDGTPLNSLYLWGLNQLFPEAKFVHNLRAPEEVALSLVHFENVGGVPQAIEEGLATWRRHAEPAWLAEKAWGPEKVFRLDYARLGNDREQLLQELLAFLGEDYAEDCLLPLDRRTNSSEVAEHKETGLATIRSAAAFESASRLYGQMQSDQTLDVAAGDELERLFNLHVRDLDLLNLPKPTSSVMQRGERFLRRLLS